jgi:tetratricopeptide (TPR) repeat protein
MEGNISRQQSTLGHAQTLQSGYTDQSSLGKSPNHFKIGIDAALDEPATLNRTGYNAPLELSPKLIETSSDFYPDFNSMGYYYLGNLQMEEAKQAFEIYLTMAGQDPYAYYSMGEYYMVAKAYDKAAQYFDQATALGMERAKERAAAARNEQLNSIVEENKGGWE